MNVKQWLATASDQEREQVAKKAGTTVGYLWQLSGNHRTPSSSLADRLERASREVTPDRVMSRFVLVFGDGEAAA
ncbi:hypothetical protein [Spongiibacter sp.]|jgi:transcriptional regulator with XRE-family HTH domain|uniref:hypothetical protein n=1 Tax=Spongiibacter sp. TaxID=2024860 RepID=UPI00257C333D|nr:hypothetical protein [Spongiibacter sp.]|tara:strand:- start:1030 stop:1254 length:225 start_codon:yes stop_codon:yes gene_type:complete